MNFNFAGLFGAIPNLISAASIQAFVTPAAEVVVTAATAIATAVSATFGLGATADDQTSAEGTTARMASKTALTEVTPSSESWSSSN